MTIDTTDNIRRNGYITNKSIRILHSPEHRTLAYIKYSYIEYIIQKIPVVIPVFIFALAKVNKNIKPINAAPSGKTNKYGRSFNISKCSPFA